MRRPTAVPDITFSARMTLELGDKQVEFNHEGRNHSDNSIVTLFPEERTLFAVDSILTGRLPFRTLADSYYPDLNRPRFVGGSFDRVTPPLLGCETVSTRSFPAELRPDTPICVERAMSSGCARRTAVMASIETDTLRCQLHAV